MKQVTGWWFAPQNKKLANGDNREIKLGITHSLKNGKIIPCKYGLHLSKRPIDALQYAQSSIIYKVVGSGVIVPHGNPVDKYACSKRKYVAGGIDVSDTLRHFARLCALDVIHLWNPPKVIIEYLNTGNEKNRPAAWDAARAAARATEWDAASDAARDAAWAAARATEWDAAWDAEWDAAEVMARAAASDAAEAMARAAARAAASAAARGAASDAAMAAARVAACEKQNKRLTRMIRDAIKKEGE